jgi:D-threonate/D-erythronate kinase
MSRVAIIADDLSSATDCGVALAQRGLRTLVPLNFEEKSQLPLDADAVALDTDSRALSPSDAHSVVTRAALTLQRADFEWIYKSVDSTLRGNLGAEIDAAMDVFGADLATIAPAFPLYGRTTAGGRHFLHGVPIDQTEIARDPKSPVGQSDLIALLSSQSGRPAGLVDLETVRAGKEAVYQRMDELKAGRVELAVFDAETEEDLAKIVGIVAGSAYRVVWVGSTGLARHLPSVVAPAVEHRERFAMPSPTRPVLLVAGSLSAVTREQIDTLKRRSGVVGVELDTLQVVAGEGALADEVRRCRAAVDEALENPSDVALHVAAAPEKRAAVEETAEEQGLTTQEVPVRIADALARVASETAYAHDLQGMVLTGGDTTKAVCRRLGATGMELLGEVEAGIPLCRFVGGNARGLPVVTKAGAFGNERSLENALVALKGEK